VTVQKSDTVPEGRIISQQPAAGAQVDAASKVDVIVAKGKPVAYVPNFIGLSLGFSESAAKQAGVGLAAPFWLPIAPNAKPKGTVIAQDPLPGQPLLSTDKVTLQVSGGPPATPTPFPTVPPTLEPTQAPATTAPESPSAAPASSSTPTAAPVARSLRIAVQLPASKEPKRVRVALVDATGSHDLYDQMTAGGFTLQFDVTVTGAGTVQTYVDGALTTSTSL
jgi:beta-lactam-binding protein with PASTA domain